MDENDFDGPDLIVAGAGGGLAGALRAAQAGLSVLVVESNERFRRGNNTSMSTAMIPAMGTRFQRDAGIDDSPELFRADVAKKTHGDFNEVATESLSAVSAELIEWLADSVGMDISLVTDFVYPGHSVARCHTIPGHSGTAMLATLVNAVNAHDMIDVMVPARLVDVVVTDGCVTAAIIETPDGREEIPTKAVLLATNGYGADPELVTQHMPEIASAIYHGSEHSRGDALRIGEALGAATDYLDAYQGHAALAMPSASLATWATIMHGGFVVNRAGERFGNETTGYSEYAAISAENAPDGAWIIIDERIHEACSGFQDFQDVIAGGGVRWGDSPAELAAEAGISPEGLARTVAMTAAVASGDESDAFERTAWEAPLTGRLAAIFIKPALFHTQGGLRVDAHAQVMRADETAIEGLYASGGAAAGISGHGASGYLAGNGLLPALGLAYIAAGHVAGR
ncbi:FAD-binding protein [uncultured Microbacterium sp.]|uniref:FAD-dependent oxidoreductase n=1 Tax=uncultured Microbacterium sp. TaxID=191216 RepID=UPI002629266C|nr:FAD-binding protein [uncultured Microbacterium sp.]